MATQHSIAQMGFWPFPEAYREVVAKLFQKGTGRVGDFQAGDGQMLQVLAEHTGLTPYANELDSIRASKLHSMFPVGQVAEGDFFDLQATSGSFSLVFCNPPFQQTGGFSRSREELEFLEDTWQTVQTGGYVIFVCYVQHMSEKVLRSMYIHSDLVETWQLPGRDLSQYLMLVTVCRKRESRYLSKAAQEKIVEGAERSALVHRKVLQKQTVTEYPMIDEAGEGRYALPEPVQRDNFVFVNTEFTAAAAAELAKLALPLFDLKPPTYHEVLEKQKSVIVPSKAHLFSLIAQGLANQCVIETERGRAVIRSQTVRVAMLQEDDEEDDGGDDKKTKKIVMRPQTRVRLLYETGQLEDISDPVALAKFVSQYSDQMIRAVADRIEPIYRFDFAGGVLEPWLSGLRLTNKRGTFDLLPAQKHAVAALLSRLKEARGAIFAGDMGVGKTVCGSAVLDALRPRSDAVSRWFGEPMTPNDYAVVVAPGHLMDKWESELRSISPDAIICRIELAGKGNPQEALNGFFRAWDTYPKHALKVVLTTDTAIKSGEHPTVWRGACETLRARGLGYHRRSEPKIYDPVSGVEIGVYRGRGNLVPKKASTLDKLPHFLHRDTHWCNRKRQPPRQARPNYVELAKKTLTGWRYRDMKENEPERYETTLRQEIRRLRIEDELRNRLEVNPLWQEVRGSSAPKADVRKLLGGRVPLPDIVMAELEPKQYRAPSNPRAINGGIGRFMAKYAHKKYGKRLHTLVVDEAHEYAHDSARGETVLTLAMEARKVLLMTGSPFGGKANSVFRMEYMINRGRMQEAGYTFNAEGQRRWAMDMGVYEISVKNEQVARIAGRVVTRDDDSESIRERPGATPMLMRWQLEHQLTLTIEEIGAHLPEYRKQYCEIDLPEVMEQALQEADRAVEVYNQKAAERKQPGVPITSVIIAHLTWLSYPFAPYAIEARHKYQDPVTFEDVETVELVHTIPALPDSFITPKELALLERIKGNMERGHGTGVYVRMTGAGKSGQKDVLGRLEALIKEHVPLARVATLRAEKVARPKREAWLAERNDHDVLLCNPITVRTGLDLYRFNDLIALEWDYSLYTMVQASRRAWRIGQTKPCAFEVWAYKDSVEIAATAIMDAKWQAVDFMTGRSFDVNAMAIDKGLIEALAEAYERGQIQVKEDLFLGKKAAAPKPEAPKFDLVLPAAERSAQVKKDSAAYGNPEINPASKTMIYRLKDGRKVVWERLSETRVVRWSLSRHGERVYSVLYEG